MKMLKNILIIGINWFHGVIKDCGRVFKYCSNLIIITMNK